MEKTSDFAFYKSHASFFLFFSIFTEQTFEYLRESILLIVI